MDIFQETPEGPVLGTNQISVERLADVEVTLESNSNHTVNTSWDKNMIISKLCPGRSFICTSFGPFQGISISVRENSGFSIFHFPEMSIKWQHHLWVQSGWWDFIFVFSMIINTQKLSATVHLWGQFGWWGGCREIQLGQSSGSSGTQAWPAIRNNATLQ